MAFFSINNPVLFVIALILLIALLKGWLSNLAFFTKKGRGVYVLPIVLVIAAVFIFNRPLMQIFTSAAAMISVLFVFLIFIFIAYAALGTRTEKAFTAVREIGFLKLIVIIAVVCIFALSISQVYGDKLLEEPKVSFSDAFVHEPEPREFDLSPFFTPKFLTGALLAVIIGMFFLYVNLQ